MLLCTIGLVSGALCALPAHADENGASLYLLGSGVPSSAVAPPLQGVYFDNTIYILDGSSGADRDLIIGGNIVADVNATVVADFATVLFVPTTNLLGGTLSLGATIPFGVPMVDARVVLTGPLGRELSVERRDSEMLVGDPVLTASLGWKSGKMHFSLGGMLNVPIGTYREGELANLAFHRWAGDVAAGLTWHDEEKGLDVGGKVGVTFNGHNDVTSYDSGTDFHVELGIEKKLSPQFSLGVLGYHFQQITDDEGSGARLGAYRGRATGAGGTIAYSTILGRAPSTFRLKVFQEFNVENRPKSTIGMISLTLPLSMKLPPHAAP